MKRIFALLVLVALSGLARTSRADETTLCNQFITTLPYTISVQGHYCFDRNLATAITTGSAITINADFVVLDLNNFKLGGGSAGLSTSAVGISADGHRNITIRNGNIRGFKIAIVLSGSNSGGHLVENNVLDGNTEEGAVVDGDTVVIRNNVIANTGGSTFANQALGLVSYGYDLASVRDNIISNTFGNGTSPYTSSGIRTFGRSVVDHNVIRMGAPSTTGITQGIYAEVCRDNTTLNATIPNACSVSVGANTP